MSVEGAHVFIQVVNKACAFGFLLLATSLAALAQSVWPEPKSETEVRNLETFRLWIEEVWENGRLELIPNLVAPQYVRHELRETRVVTPENYAREIEANKMQRELSFEQHAMVLDGDLLWVRWSGIARSPEGVSQGMVRGIEIHRFEGGKLIETWNVSESGQWNDTR